VSTPVKLVKPRLAARAVTVARTGSAGVLRQVGAVGFPYRAPSTPNDVELLPAERRLGADYDTEWARRPLARTVRNALAEGPLRLAVHGLASPQVRGVDRLADLRRLDDSPPLIFAPNHHSHLDTPVSISTIPRPWRHRLVVGAAADYFFGTRVTAAASALVLGAFPIDRQSVGRASAELARDLIDDGWSLLIYPEGGRSPDGWGQPFRGGAAYLSIRTGAAVVPMFIEGTGQLFGKGMKRPRIGRAVVTFGRPLVPEDGESTRRFNDRIEQAVTELGDEALTDWGTARRRAAAGTSPALTGPEHTGWRRAWALAEHRRSSSAGRRRRQQRRWPKLD
jgi:1-acyl-sn-glycerol-3-phosphate acyltransferase